MNSLYDIKWEVRIEAKDQEEATKKAMKILKTPLAFASAEVKIVDSGCSPSIELTVCNVPSEVYVGYRGKLCEDMLVEDGTAYCYCRVSSFPDRDCCFYDKGSKGSCDNRLSEEVCTSSHDWWVCRCQWMIE